MTLSRKRSLQPADDFKAKARKTKEDIRTEAGQNSKEMMQSTAVLGKGG
jgi:hypothetical protein